MRIGDPEPVHVSLRVDESMWEVTPDPTTPGPSDPEFREHLIAVANTIAAGALHTSPVVLADSHGSILHPLALDSIDVHLADTAHVFVESLNTGLQDRESIVEMRLSDVAHHRMREAYQVALVLSAADSDDIPNMLRGYEVLVSFDEALPDNLDEVPIALRAAAEIPRDWLFPMRRADLTYLEAADLLATRAPEDVLQTVQMMLALRDAANDGT